MPPRRRAVGATASAPASATAIAPTGPLTVPPPAVPLPILETDWQNRPLSPRDHRREWTRFHLGRGRNDTFMTVNGPRWGWVPVYDQDSEHGGPVAGLSGTIVQEPEVSPSDLPLLHPFGNDFEFHIAPDPQYFDLLARTGDNLYEDSTRRARTEFGLTVPNVIGMEWDSGMVPRQYRPKKGDRVCVWGRWIIDAGHNDFHTEIHPPVLMVSGHAKRSQFQMAGARTQDATYCTFLARPYLVSQMFNNGLFGETGLLGHLIHEWADAEALMSFQMKAHPKLMRMPFEGLNIMMFKLRPPTPRIDRRDKLMVTTELARRDDSCAISVLRGTDGDSVRVVVVLNDASYVPPAGPPQRNVRYTISQIKADDPDVGNIIDGIMSVNAVLNPVAANTLSKGIETHRFKNLAAPPLTRARTVEVREMHSPDVPANNSHPFPVAGKITVEWKRYGVTQPQGPVAPATRR